MARPSFAKRSRQSEMMDDIGIGYITFSNCLRDLARVNILTLGYRPTLGWLRHRVARLKPGNRFSVLDVGSGGGDMLRQIARWTKASGSQPDLTGIDLNPWSKQHAIMQKAAMPITYQTADIFALDDTYKADFIISSLFTHHLTDNQIVQFLRWMDRHARHGWFINDLHRHPVAYYSFKFLSWLLRFHFMVRHDGPISVARAFSRSDWRRYFAAADIQPDQVTIRWYFPFRYGIARRLP